MKQYISLLWLIFLCLSTSAQKNVTAGSDSAVINTFTARIDELNKINPDSAYLVAQQGLAFATGRKLEKGRAQMLASLAFIDRNQGRVDLAEQRLEEALELYTSSNNKPGEADILSNIGAIEASKGNFDGAAKRLFAALKIQETLGHSDALLTTYLDLAKVYLEQPDSANARKYLTMATETSKKVPLSNEVISLYNTLGIFYIYGKDTAKGLQTFLADLELSDKPQFANAHVECLLYLGTFYIDKNEPDKAIRYLDEAFILARDKKMPEEESNILLMKAVIVKSKDQKAALEYLNQAVEISYAIHNRFFLISVFDEIANIYKESGMFKEALAETEKKQRLRDSIYSTNSALEIAGISAHYEFEKSTARIAELEFVHKEDEFERHVIIAVTIGIILILTVLLYYYHKTTLLVRQLRLHEKELEELNNMKNKLFSIIGHDLRGPIARIPAMIEIYEDGATAADEKKFLSDNLKEYTKATTETLDKLLYWGQSLMKGNMISQAKIKPKLFIRDAIEFKKVAAADKQITIEDKTPEDLFVYADPTHFDFVIRNLLANAIKYTYRNGLIIIDCDTRSRLGFTVFSVKDNGVGIDKLVLPKIFNPLSSTYGTANEKGTGIGLMLCREFIVQNGGEIWVESEAGKGSTFFFSVKNVQD